MRNFKALCILGIAVASFYTTAVCEDRKTLNVKIGDLTVKVTIEGKDRISTKKPLIQLPKDDQISWKIYRQAMNSSSPDGVINKFTTIFDRILITNAFARSEIDDGKKLYQGDISINEGNLGRYLGTRSKRAVNAFENLRWTLTEGVPYKIHGSLNDKARRAIRSAMNEWERSLPCIKWRAKSNSDQSFVHFFQGQGCYSTIGRVGGEQPLSIGKGCEYHGIALHELGHALGFFHEQSRPDRDNYVDIVKENIIEGLEFQFSKMDESLINSYGVPYDYGSIMHYPRTAFAKFRNLETIRAKGKRDIKFGQRDRLSVYDIQQARWMYGCNVTDYAATLPSTEATTAKITPPETTQETNTPNKMETTTLQKITPSTTIIKVPNKGPAVVSLIPESSTSLNVTWKKLPVDEYDGNIVEYVICYKTVDEDSDICLQNKTTTDVTEDTVTFTLNGLKEHMFYEVAVKLRTLAGIGPIGSSLTALTEEKEPLSSGTGPLTEIPLSTESTSTSTEPRVLITTIPPTTVLINTVTRVSKLSTETPTTDSILHSSVKVSTKSIEVCDLLTTCYKWIRVGYCSRHSSNYHFMSYFCSATCDMWRKSALSRGATCVDLHSRCPAWSNKGKCTAEGSVEYFNNMCCDSCREKNCKDEDRHCLTWAEINACSWSQYVRKNCKRTCDLCY